MIADRPAEDYIGTSNMRTAALMYPLPQCFCWTVERSVSTTTAFFVAVFARRLHKDSKVLRFGELYRRHGSTWYV